MSAERERVKNAEEDDRRMRKYVLRYNARSEQKVRVRDEQVVFQYLATLMSGIESMFDKHVDQIFKICRLPRVYRGHAH